MSNEITQFEFENLPVRIVDKDGSPWFVAKDVCSILGLSHVTSSMRKLDDDERDVLIVHTLGGPQEMIGVSESGLYALILRSKKPQAKVFRKMDHVRSDSVHQAHRELFLWPSGK